MTHPGTLYRARVVIIPARPIAELIARFYGRRILRPIYTTQRVNDKEK